MLKIVSPASSSIQRRLLRTEWVPFLTPSPFWEEETTKRRKNARAKWNKRICVARIQEIHRDLHEMAESRGNNALTSSNWKEDDHLGRLGSVSPSTAEEAVLRHRSSRSDRNFVRTYCDQKQWRMSTILVIAALCLLFGVATSAGSYVCPMKCTCLDQYVQCSRKNLETAPSDVPKYAEFLWVLLLIIFSPPLRFFPIFNLSVSDNFDKLSGHNITIIQSTIMCRCRIRSTKCLLRANKIIKLESGSLSWLFWCDIWTTQVSPDDKK